MEGYGWLIALGVFVLMFSGTVVFLRRKIREAARLLFGMDSLWKGIQERTSEEATTPKSVSSMTSICLPLIQKDFPEFNWNEYRGKAGNVLMSFLRAIDRADAALLDPEANVDLVRRTELLIGEDEKRGVRHRYDGVSVHRTEIAGYNRNEGTCVIRLQSAVGCLDYTVKDGAVIAGSDTVTRQTKFDMELIYVQDADQLSSRTDTAIAATCPNCGAPVASLGHRTCAYCGAALEPINVRVWSFGTITESAAFSLPAR